MPRPQKSFGNLEGLTQSLWVIFKNFPLAHRVVVVADNEDLHMFERYPFQLVNWLGLNQF